MHLKTSLSPQDGTFVYLCDVCDREQLAFSAVQSNGLTSEEAEQIGWVRQVSAQLCPFCSGKEKH